MNKLTDFLKPESMLTGNFVGGSIAGIGAAFATVFPSWNNGYVVLISALLFGILMATQTLDAKRGKLIFVVYLLLGTGLGMWEAVQSGTFIESKIVPVKATEVDRVFVDRAGNYVAIRGHDMGQDEHRAPAWAVHMYCDHLAEQAREPIMKQSPWKIKF